MGKQKRKDLGASRADICPGQPPLALEYCTCSPLSALHEQLLADHLEDEGLENEQVVPAMPALSNRLRAVLNEELPHVHTLSILVLHISQWERSQEPSFCKLRYHAPAGLLEQILTSMRRVMRAGDRMLIQQEAGAAIVLPHVDRQGAYGILERVSHSISLLQAQTVTPPLTRETSILLGVGTYPEAGLCIDELLYYAGLTAWRFAMRPALMSILPQIVGNAEQEGADNEDETSDLQWPKVPFMKLPATVPLRLRRLLPYEIALNVRCAPVGRDHHRLTVALADPSNVQAVQLLREVTGLAIFPVSCEARELDSLLAQKW